MYVFYWSRLFFCIGLTATFSNQRCGSFLTFLFAPWILHFWKLFYLFRTSNVNAHNSQKYNIIVVFSTPGFFFLVQYPKKKKLKSDAAFYSVLANLHFPWPCRLRSSLERPLGNLATSNFCESIMQLNIVACTYKF